LKIFSIAVLIATVGATTAFAQTPWTAAPARPAALAFIGSPAPATAAGRSIVIGADTTYVNVTAGTTVRFVIGEQSFTWNFQPGGLNVAPVDLRLLAPAGALDHKVIVYVADDPLYQG
jgi:hypothetical protein